MTSDDAPDLRLALRHMVGCARTLLEQYEDAGSAGIPIGVASSPGPEVVPLLCPEPVVIAPLTLFDVSLPSSPSVVVPKLSEERKSRLDVLANEVSGCIRCALHQERKKTVFARGNPRASLCFVGEGPGADEDAQGLPFVGKAGQLLDRMIAAMGLTEDDVYICNVVKCRPPQNRKPEPSEMSSCLGFLTEQIALVEPKVLVALGATAAEGLLGGKVAITRVRGQWKLYRSTIPLMLTYHPAYLLRTPTAKRDAWEDLKAVLERLGRAVPTRGG